MAESTDTRKLLKVFGVSVTDFEEESRRISQKARNLQASNGEFVKIVQDALESVQEVNMRWFEVTSRILEIQRKMLGDVIESAKRRQQ